CESLKKDSQAIEVYEKLLQSGTVKREWIVPLFNLYITQNRIDDILDLYEKQKSVVYNDRSALLLVAQAFIEQKNYDASLEILQKITAEQPTLEEIRRIGTIFYLKKDYDQAEQVFIELLEQYPDDPDILQTLVSIYSEEGNYHNAVQLMERYVSKHISYEAFYTLAGLYEQKGDVSSAQKYYQKTLDALAVIPQTVKTIKMSAFCFQKTGKYERAAAYYEDAIRQDKSDVLFFRDYIAYLVFDRMMYAHAIAMVLSSPSDVQNDTVVARYCAQAHIGLKQFDFAETIISDLLKQSPNDPDLLMEMAFIMQSKGRWDNALKIYQDVMRTRNGRAKEAEKEARSLLRTYAPQVRTGYLLIEEINKDTTAFYSQSQAYLLHNLLVRAGFSHYLLKDKTNIAIGKIKENLTEWGIEFEYLINPDWSIQFGPFVITNSPQDIYSATFGIQYNNHKDLYARLTYSHDDKLLDPRSAVPYGGRSDHVDFNLSWDFNEVVKFLFEGVHNQYRFSDNVRQFGVSRSPGTRDHFIAGIDIAFLHDPRIAFQYRYIWDDTRIDRDFAALFPISAKTRGHAFQIHGEQYVTEKIFVHGTFLVGHDDERDLFLEDLASYGYEFGGVFQVTDYFELGGYYQFRFEKGSDSRSGRTHYADVHGVIHF
ncbi:tetratricopeptide repeat protein, partial [bacterium]|nr:tetratricopeptide repeat protein [bacterium]